MADGIAKDLAMNQVEETPKVEEKKPQIKVEEKKQEEIKEEINDDNLNKEEKKEEKKKNARQTESLGKNGKYKFSPKITLKTATPLQMPTENPLKKESGNPKNY